MALAICCLSQEFSRSLLHCQLLLCAVYMVDARFHVHHAGCCSAATGTCDRGSACDPPRQSPQSPANLSGPHLRLQLLALLLLPPLLLLQPQFSSCGPCGWLGQAAGPLSLLAHIDIKDGAWLVPADGNVGSLCDTSTCGCTFVCGEGSRCLPMLVLHVMLQGRQLLQPPSSCGQRQVRPMRCNCVDTRRRICA
jgi:hypothetical protein